MSYYPASEETCYFTKESCASEAIQLCLDAVSDCEYSIAEAAPELGMYFRVYDIDNERHLTAQKFSDGATAVLVNEDDGGDIYYLSHADAVYIKRKVKK